MSDHDAIQGLWRLTSSTNHGDKVYTGTTHHLFSGDTHRQIDPSHVDTGRLRTTFRLDETADPKRIEFVLDYSGPDGPPDPEPLVWHYLYRLEGDALTLCSGGGGFPKAISEEYTLETLERDPGPVPQTRQPSGTPPLEDARIGTLTWDDNLHYYSGEITVGGARFWLGITPDKDQDAATALASARRLLESWERQQERVKVFAVRQLFALANDWADDEDEQPLSKAQFAARMTLTDLSVYADGSATFTFDDGGLFAGHVIQVSMEADGSLTNAGIAG